MGDLRVLVSPLSCTPCFVSFCIVAIAFMPEEDKFEYMEAVRLAPHLVDAESHPMRFLSTDVMNPWSAASRITLYWKHRKEIFQNRWLLAMNDLSGNDALMKHEVKSMKVDVVFLKKQPGGVSVIYTDFAKVPKNQSIMYTGRLAYYVFTTLDDADIETIGFIWIHARTPDFFSRARSNKGRAVELLRVALPLRIRKVFYLIRQGRNEALFSLSNPLMAIVSEFFLGSPPQFISEARKEDAYDTLHAHGLSDDYIPHFLGGTWELERAARDEAGPDASLSDTNIINSHAGDAARRNSLQSTESLSTQATTFVARTRHNANRGRKDTDYLRKRNAGYSRKNYYKKKEEIEQLKADRHTLKIEAVLLKEENKRLEGLLSQIRSQFPFVAGV